MVQAYGERAALRRPLTLALLVGLFAMHGTALDAHAAHAAPPPVTGSPVAAGHAMTGPATPHVMTPSAGSPSARLEDRGDGSPVVVTGSLCVAVLLALGLSRLIPRSLGSAVAVSGAARLSSRTRTSLPARGPPRDLLAQLCVLRT